MPEFMLSLRAACLKLRKEEKTVQAGAVKRITLGRSTRFDNNNNNMLDLALNFFSHWDDWIRLLPAQETGRQGESCLIRVKKMRGGSLMTYPCLPMMGLL